MIDLNRETWRSGRLSDKLYDLLLNPRVYVASGVRDYLDDCQRLRRSWRPTAQNIMLRGHPLVYFPNALRLAMVEPNVATITDLTAQTRITTFALFDDGRERIDECGGNLTIFRSFFGYHVDRKVLSLLEFSTHGPIAPERDTLLAHHRRFGFSAVG